MSPSIWSGLLIASIIQCVFLLILLHTRSHSKKAKNLLSVLLIITLLINVSNWLTASYLYREIPAISGFARGMVLLLGPLLYLYIQSIINDRFQLKWIHVLHFVPYFISIVFIRVQMYGVPNEIYISAVDYLMEGRIKMTFTSSLWFIAYFIHLSVYALLSRRFLKTNLNAGSTSYLVSLDERKKWIEKLSVFLVVLAILFLGITAYGYISGVYSAAGNFIYTLVLAAMVYVITYQAIFKGELLAPNFKRKYGGSKMTDHDLEAVRIRFHELFDTQKVYLEPDLRLNSFAEMMRLQPHAVSSFINSEFNKSFTELIHEKRVEEFRKRIENNDHEKLSIIGIAYELGYNSKSAFNAAFKKETNR